MAKRKTLWATTRIGPKEVKIYKDPKLVNFDGATHQGKHGIWIDIATPVFSDPPLFDSILIHEFIHVLEYHYVEALDWTEREKCSAGVRLLGTGLAQMLRELRVKGLKDA